MLRSESKIEFHDFYKYRVSYITVSELNLIFLFVASLTDKIENIQKELIRCKNEFLNLFEEILDHKFDAKTFDVFDPTIDVIHRNLRPKISLIGFSGVGKTTITKLIKADEIPTQHIPTITGDIATIKIGKLHFHLWDFAGQEQFSYLWNNFIKGSDAVLLITNSSLENVEKSKYFLELIKEQAPNAQSAVIGNKQDLKNAMNPVQIEKILGLKTYSMIAKNPNNRDKMIQIIADILEMSAEVSPLLKPLLERDKLTEEAVGALKNADFNKAAFLFDKISDLCIELGDDSLGMEFYEKSQKIKEMLSKVGAPPPTPGTSTGKKIKEISPLFQRPKVPEPAKPLDTEEALINSKTSPIPPKLPPTQIQEVLTPPKPLKEIDTKLEPLTPVEIKGVEPITAEKIIQEEAVIQEEVIEPKAPQEPIGLKLNPEDFFVKARPKTVSVVPKDAKYKLKTSPFSHVKNVDDKSIPSPISPVRMMQQKDNSKEIKSKEIPKTISKPEPEKLKDVTSVDEVSKSIPTLKKDIKQSLLELKIKKANISKMSIDFDMKELMGEITPLELQEKKDKLNVIIQKIDDEIKELENLLSD